MSVKKKHLPLDLNSEINFSSHIKYKKSKNLQFNVYYGILYVNGMFVLLNTSDKKNRNIYFTISMKDVSRVEPVLSSMEPFSFMLVPYISTKSVVYLSAFNGSEMKNWIFNFTQVRKNLHVLISDVFFDPHQNDEPQYLDLSEFNMSCDSQCYDTFSGSQNEEPTIVNDLINLDHAESNSYGELSAGPCYLNTDLISEDKFSEGLLNSNVDLISEDSYHNINSYHYYNSANFFGTKQQSFQILKEKSFNGSYLVRTDSLSNEKFLDVWDDYLILSFELICQNNYVKLKGDSMHFDNITYLLYHYSFNKLPNSCSHLEIPFRLIDY